MKQRRGITHTIVFHCSLLTVLRMLMVCWCLFCDRHLVPQEIKRLNLPTKGSGAPGRSEATNPSNFIHRTTSHWCWERFGKIKPEWLLQHALLVSRSVSSWFQPRFSRWRSIGYMVSIPKREPVGLRSDQFWQGQAIKRNTWRHTVYE